MSLDDPNDLAPEDTGETSAPSSPKKGRQAFKTVTRELSEEDLANPAVQKLLLDDLDRLETENEEQKKWGTDHVFRRAPFIKNVVRP
jgi:hypothetical protein